MIMAQVSLKAKHRSDTIIGVIWAVGMAIGIVALDLTPGYNVDLMSYLSGSILTVPTSDLWKMAGIAVAITVLIVAYYNEFLALSYDEEFAQIRGVPVKRLYFLFIGMLAVTIVMVIQVVGLILVIALLTIPPFMVERDCRSLGQMMVFSSLAGMAFTLTGLWLSYRFDLTSGSSIILVSGTTFLVSLVVDQIRLAVKNRVGQY